VSDFSLRKLEREATDSQSGADLQSVSVDRFTGSGTECNSVSQERLGDFRTRFFFSPRQEVDKTRRYGQIPGHPGFFGKRFEISLLRSVGLGIAAYFSAHFVPVHAI